MDDRQHFKAAFIAGCIEAGHTTPQEITALIKQGGGIPFFSQAGDLATSLAESVGGWALPLGIGLPIGAGALAGYGAAKATDIGEDDVEAAKKQEIIDEYRRQTAKLHREGLVRRTQNREAGSGRLFL